MTLLWLLAQSGTPTTSPSPTAPPSDSADLTNPVVLAIFAVIVAAFAFFNWRLRRRR